MNRWVDEYMRGVLVNLNLQKSIGSFTYILEQILNISRLVEFGIQNWFQAYVKFLGWIRFQKKKKPVGFGF